MDDEFKELQTLLRLKKYEEPPQGFPSYGERFLKEFHRRQRWENTQKTGWARWQEKVSEWFEAVSVPRYAYAATLAVFAAVALAINGLQPAERTATVAATTVSTGSAAAPRAGLALNSQIDLSDLEVQSKMEPGSQIANSEIQPRYILDARPASYNAGFSF